MTPRRSARNKNPSEPHKDKTDYLSTEEATKKKIVKTAKKQVPKSKAETGKTSAVEMEKTTKKKPVKNAKKENLKSEADTGKTTIVEEEQTTTATSKRVGRKTAKRTEDQSTVDSEDPPHKISKLISAETTEADEENSEESVDAESIYEFKANNIKGEEIPLKEYKGHVCIIVNVASRCGHTKSNYEQLVQLHDEYSESKGLRILAFPCNQFGKQEPGDAQKICEFAEKRNVKFDMFDKIDVNGKNAHPLWKFMQDKIAGPKGNKIDWNFTKFIIDKEGNVVERHKPSVKPLQMVEDLEKYW